MKGVFYEKFGPADDVLTFGDMVDPVPAPGQVLVRVHASGVNPSDVKLRAGARPDTPMVFPRIVPHSDGAGVIEHVGEGVDRARLGQRVWIWNAQWQRAFGTASELICVPQEHAVPLPDTTSFAEGACLGIPAMTAWYALFGHGRSIEGKTVLVTGGAGTVGRYACQMARLSGAEVITTVSSEAKATHSTCRKWVNYRKKDAAQAVLDMTQNHGVDLIVDVDFAANAATSLAVLKPGGTIAAYASASDPAPTLNFYPMMFRNLTLRMLIVYLLEPELRRKGEAAITSWLEQGALSHAVVAAGGLDQTAKAHDLVAGGKKLGTVVLEF